MAECAELLQASGLMDNPAHVGVHQHDSGEWEVFVGYSRDPARTIAIAAAVQLVTELRKFGEHNLADRFEAAADTARRYSLRAGTHEDMKSRHKYRMVGRAKPALTTSRR